jgi:hypothetical protein
MVIRNTHVTPKRSLMTGKTQTGRTQRRIWKRGVEYYAFPQITQKEPLSQNPTSRELRVRGKGTLSIQYTPDRPPLAR